MRDMAPVVAEEVPKDEADALLEKLAEGIVQRRLAVPAVLFLETCKPLNFVGSQLMMAFHPFVAAFVKGDEYRKVALLMEDDAVVEELLQRVERKDASVKARERKDRAEARLASGPRGVKRLWTRVLGRADQRGGDGHE